MKIPENPLTPQEALYNIEHGIFEIVEAMLEEKERAELEKDSE